MNNNSNPLRLAFAFVGLIVCLCVLVVGNAYAQSQDRVASQTDAMDAVLFDCEQHAVAEDIGDGVYGPGIGPDLAAILLSAGWRGVPSDGGEILYSPACDLP